jgi:hypothetical protein
MDHFFLLIGINGKERAFVLPEGMTRDACSDLVANAESLIASSFHFLEKESEFLKILNEHGVTPSSGFSALEFVITLNTLKL